MKFKLIYLFLFVSVFLEGTTLKELYDTASPNGIYDKELILNTGQIYTGSLLIGGTYNHIPGTFTDTLGANVNIVGNGAVLDLQGGFITIQYTDKRLDITDCVIINGGVKFRGSTAGTNLIPQGSVSYVTFYQAEDYAVRINSAGQGITITNNIFLDTYTTGDDFVNYTSETLEWLPTGHNLVSTIFIETYGPPLVSDNWSFFSDWRLNQDELRHYGLF
ncbi:hypothetical protein JEZ13_02515 [bacterium]|nr:hypothetical protein [bacterium]